jgi:hypothetical protein
MNIEELSELLKKYEDLKDYIINEPNRYDNMRQMFNITYSSVLSLISDIENNRKIDLKDLKRIEEHFDTAFTFMRAYTRLKDNPIIKNAISEEYYRLLNTDLKDIKGKLGEIE